MRGHKSSGAALADAGVYVLILRLDGGPLRLRVGALGERCFPRGYYCYVGSARNGLSSRLERHLGRRPRKPRWHIDYLAARAGATAALVWRTTEPLECQLSKRVSGIASGAVERFGSSDCRCRSHLYFFTDDPDKALRRIRLVNCAGSKVTATSWLTDEFPCGSGLSRIFTPGNGTR